MAIDYICILLFDQHVEYMPACLSPPLGQTHSYYYFPNMAFNPHCKASFSQLNIHPSPNRFILPFITLCVYDDRLNTGIFQYVHQSIGFCGETAGTDLQRCMWFHFQYALTITAPVICGRWIQSSGSAIIPKSLRQLSVAIKFPLRVLNPFRNFKYLSSSTVQARFSITSSDWCKGAGGFAKISPPKLLHAIGFYSVSTTERMQRKVFVPLSYLERTGRQTASEPKSIESFHTVEGISHLESIEAAAFFWCFLGPSSYWW